MPQETAQIPALTPEQQKKLVDEAIERLDRLAESDLEMARLFVDRGKTDIGRRRLQEIIDRYGKSASAKDAQKLLKTLRPFSEVGLR
jgi:TolA-binding protein